MKPQRLVQQRHKIRGKLPKLAPDPFHCHGSDLLCLRFRIPRKASSRGRQEHLEGVDMFGVRRHWNNGENTAPETLGRAVGSIVAHDDGRSTIVRLAPAHRIKVDETDLASMHQMIPSSIDVSQALSSWLRDHSSQAPS